MFAPTPLLNIQHHCAPLVPYRHSKQDGICEIRIASVVYETPAMMQMTGLDPPDATHVPLTPAELAERIDWLPEEEKEFVRETEVDFIQESMEVIAEAAQTLPAGTTVGTTIPMLSNLGHEGAVAAARAHLHSHDGTEGHANGAGSADAKPGDAAGKSDKEAQAKESAAPALLATR